MKKLVVDEKDLSLLGSALSKCIVLVSSIKNGANRKNNVCSENRNGETYLNSKDASDILGISIRTLDRWKKNIDFECVKSRDRCYYKLSRMKMFVDTKVIMLDHKKMAHFKEKYEKITTGHKSNR